ncbi:MAG: ATP-dependent zinc metalloprotease FtsH [Bacteroidetes bacterium]|nr:ATP-dependent zinc metalloprotease FtsH [Bacteroidota bacterium]
MELNKNENPTNNENGKRKGDLGQKKPTQPKFNAYWIFALLLIVILLFQAVPNNTGVQSSWEDLKKMIEAKDVKKVQIVNDRVVKVYLTKEALENSKYENLKKSNSFLSTDVPQFYFETNVDYFQTQLENLRKEYPEEVNAITVDFKTEHDFIGPILQWIIMIALFIGLWMFIMRRMSGGGAGGPGQIFSIGKSRAQLFDKNTKVNITFKDVAGLDEAKVEVMEIVDFLKNPKKYTNLGGKIPKGALLVGPPGTGKTLMAKAVAGEAGVPFFSLSGSDFVEMFVGVGASRVRDLFKQAKEKAPCIIFIDEIDAIGRARGKNLVSGGNDERENTLNQLLTEMDGFGTDSGVIILAATNRPDILDSALLRPGRFDRQISIDKPDLVGREQIFKVHLKPVKLADDVDPKKLAAQTPGFAGAEIANVCNEAALIAARKNKPAVEMQDFQDAIDRVIGGLEKKNKLISPEEKRIVAYHEAGHAVAGWFLEHADPLVKVSIVPRGIAALGYAQYLPKEQFLYRTNQLLDTMCMALGGRASEDIFFGEISTGAQNDLERVTKMAYNMVTIYGMSEKVGQVSFYDPTGEYGYQKPYSEKTSEMIDEEVRKIIDHAYQTVKKLILEKKNETIILAEELLKKEILFQSDLEKLIGKRPFDTKTTYESYMEGDSNENDKVNNETTQPEPQIITDTNSDNSETVSNEERLPTEEDQQ